MQVELYCARCNCCYADSPEAPADEVIERMIDEGPWYSLGDGQTFEDMIFNALMRRGGIHCPECGEPVSVSEESLGRLSMELLGCS